VLAERWVNSNETACPVRSLAAPSLDFREEDIMEELGRLKNENRG
jgi:hypothetical protein